MQARWRESNLTIARAKYYILWCTKYRRPVLDGCIQKRLKEIIYNRAKNIDSNIERLSIKEDRVEMIVSSSALNAPHYLVQQFKRISSFLLRSEFKELRSKLPSSRRTDNLLALFQLRLRENQLEQGVDQKADQKHKRANQHNKKQLHASPSSTGAEMTYCTGISNLSVSRWSSIWNA